MISAMLYAFLLTMPIVVGAYMAWTLFDNIK